MSLEISLYQIEIGLRDLYGMREELLAVESPDVQTLEELKVINETIREYCRAEIKKADGIADFILMLDRLSHEPRERKGVNERCELDREIDRLRARRDMLREVRDNVEANVTAVMQEMPWKEGKPKKLEGVRHSITLSGNGGRQPVTVTDETLVPDEFKRAIVSIPMVVWQAIVVAAIQGQVVPMEQRKEIVALRDSGKREVSISAVEVELNLACEPCEGNGTITGRMACSGSVSHAAACGGGCGLMTCEACGGTGKRGVPGARLEPRGTHLRIK